MFQRTPMGFSPLASHCSTVFSEMSAVLVLFLISNEGGAKKKCLRQARAGSSSNNNIIKCYNSSSSKNVRSHSNFNILIHTLHSNLGHSRDPSDPIRCLAQVVALVGLLDVLDDQGAIYNMHVAIP